jgi:hypothetical protein
VKGGRSGVRRRPEGPNAALPGIWRWASRGGCVRPGPGHRWSYDAFEGEGSLTRPNVALRAVGRFAAAELQVSITQTRGIGASRGCRDEIGMGAYRCTEGHLAAPTGIHIGIQAGVGSPLRCRVGVDHGGAITDP